MSSRTIILSGEYSVAAGIANSITVDNATVVRVFNSSGGDLIVSVSDPTGANEYAGVGSITMPDNHVEFIEKKASYTIWGDAGFMASKVGYTG
jgi:hypothetical protein